MRHSLPAGPRPCIFQLATLTDVHWSTSGEAVLMTLMGGLGTIFGPFVGAVVIVSLEHHLAGLGSWVTFIMGLIFMACVLMFREGLVGTSKSLWLRRKPLPATPPEAPVIAKAS